MNESRSFIRDLTDPCAWFVNRISEATAYGVLELLAQIGDASLRRQISYAETAHLEAQCRARLKAMPTPEQYRAAVACLPIEELELDMRAYNVLTKSHCQVRFVGQLLDLTEVDILDLRNAGTKTLENVKARLWDVCGLTLKQGETR